MEKLLTSIISSCLPLLAISSETQAKEQTLVLPCKEATSIISVEPTLQAAYRNFGASPQLFASFYYTSIEVNYHRKGLGDYALLRFAPVTLPENAVITSVELIVTADETRTMDPVLSPTLKVWQIAPDNQGWVEGAGKGAPDRGATGIYQDQTSYVDPENHDGIRWASGGAFNIGNGDLLEERGQLELPNGPKKDQSYTVQLGSSAVDDWIADPQLAQAGLAMHLDASSETYGELWLSFYSIRAEVPAEKIPHLKITYTTP